MEGIATSAIKIAGSLDASARTRVGTDAVRTARSSALGSSTRGLGGGGGDEVGMTEG
jgi:hypothetical protein